MYMSFLAILSGANGYMDMELWIKSKKDELTRLLGHRFIAPADNTIRNVYLNSINENQKISIFFKHEFSV